ncbi:serine hydrolase [Streptosporangium sp. NPDC051023]|uniref:serine hydrolase n=1 Tax=Streptosporangium sp. NPDC051023 TaxID=3155410 RepID=UPI00344B38C1
MTQRDHPRRTGRCGPLVPVLLSLGALVCSCAGIGVRNDSPGANQAREVAANAARTLAPAPPPQPPPLLTPEKVGAAVAGLDGIIRATMAETGVPGMAVAVVHQDRELYLKGFGVRRIGSPGAVGPDTVFQLASLSKPLTSTVVAGVVGRETAGRQPVSWDDPVVAHDPAFALKDPWVSGHVTLADLLSHRAGLPGHAGDLLEDLGYDRGYILAHLRYEPLGPFRASYAYTNFGFTEAAVAVARAEGTAWEDLAAEVLLKPLGMNSTGYRYADYARAPDRAALHVRRAGHWLAGQTRDANAQSPAGGASSTARDMTRWMRLQLAGGKLADRQLVGAAARGGLAMRLGPGDRWSPLTHYDGDTFAYQPWGENANGPSAVRFTAGPSGEIATVTVENLDTTGLGTFARAS